MIYAGIGSRETPVTILNRMEQWATYFARCRVTLRSGGARGADSTFELGHDLAMMDHLAPKEIFTASMSTHVWREHARKYHPKWERCSYYTQDLHARNSAIMLGTALNEPVDFVMCWTPNGKAIGGTGQALRIAEAYKIPVFNMFHSDCEEQLREWLKKASK